MESAWNTHHDLEETTTTAPLKCVWMLAEIVAYKLCDRQYDCEHCPFDSALRESASTLLQGMRSPSVSELHQPPTVIVKPPTLELWKVKNYELAKMVFYHPAHVWARIEDGGQVRIGLDDFGQRLVDRIYSVNLPEPGVHVRCGRAAWSIVHRVGETRLAAPVTGVVQQTNEKLELNPSLINRDAYGQGWAMVIQPERLMENLTHLYYGEQAEEWYDQDIARLHRGLRTLIENSRPEVGVTLQDGGALIEDLARVIKTSQLLHIIDTFLSAPIGCERDVTEDHPIVSEDEMR